MENTIRTATGPFQWEEIIHDRLKYRVVKDHSARLRFKPPARMVSEYFDFTTEGVLTLRAGYCWDGASGPTIDTKSTMRASAAHDAGYQMIRDGYLPSGFKSQIDAELGRLMREDYHPKNIISRGWSNFRAGYYVLAVRLFGGSSCKPRK